MNVGWIERRSITLDDGRVGIRHTPLHGNITKWEWFGGMPQPGDTITLYTSDARMATFKIVGRNWSANGGWVDFLVERSISFHAEESPLTQAERLTKEKS
jgi:hypothetical protein